MVPVLLRTRSLLGRPVTQLTVSDGTVLCATVSPSGAPDADLVGLILREDAMEVLELQKKMHRMQITSVEFSNHDSQIFATTSLDGRVSIADLRSKQTSQLALLAPEADMYCSAWHPTDQCLAVGTDQSITLIDIRQMKPLKRLDHHTDRVNSLCFAAGDVNAIVSGSDDSLIVVADVVSEEVLSCLNTDVSVRDVSTITSEIISSTSSVETLALWQVPSPTSCRYTSSLPVETADVEVTEAERRAEMGSYDMAKLMDDCGAIKQCSLLSSGYSHGYLLKTVYDQKTERVHTLGGSVSGHLMLFHVNLDGVEPVAPFCREVEGGMPGTGHMGVVR
ncbi:MAG: hypothetical protein KVP17_001226 [Porospora cf. gigantea B]|uniref:uncharacterized protein n=1 Tax=Porospora cf. gigantea B TaxID=2853592 RepID=UPI003571ED6C|nr:MAG: hypothetical protein KVP17_001226 [Porospora cf. gigantea B]